jgi:pre-mRNA-splicing helicase BRR2
LIETVLNDLKASECVAIEDMYLKPLNLGLIASYYYISYTTIERFSSMLTQKTKMKRLLEILASSSEYAELPGRPGEEDFIERLVRHQRFSIEKPYGDPHVKANALLQAHFSRHNVVGNLAADQREILLSAHRLLQAMVDVISSNGWLSLALNAMELSQMVTQGMWDRDSVLLQVPHFTKDLARRCRENEGKPIENIFDLAEMGIDEMQYLLQLSNSQLQDIVEFFKQFPSVDMAYKVCEGDNVSAGDKLSVQVTLERDLTNLPSDVGPVHAPRFPKPKEEGWWLVIGDSSTNQLLAIKRVALQKQARVKLEFGAPAEAGRRDYMIYLMSDSYLGCDQESEFTVDVKDAAG